MARGMHNQKHIVESGMFPLYRYNPALAMEGKNPFKLDSKAPSMSVKEYTATETRFSMLTKSNPAEAEKLVKLSQAHVDEKYRYLAGLEKMFADGVAAEDALKVIA